MPRLEATLAFRTSSLPPGSRPSERLRSEETAHIPTTTNMTSAPSCARSTAEEAVRTRAEGSTCATAEEVDTRRLIHSIRQRRCDLRRCRRRLAL